MGDGATLLKEMKSIVDAGSGSLKVHLQRWTWEVDLVKGGDSTGLGMRMRPKFAFGEISQVAADGPIAEWNAAHPDEAVAKDDLILDVNGISESRAHDNKAEFKDLAEAAKDCKQARVLVL